MSMNLMFETVKGGYRVDFPFQTPTTLTYAVLNATDTTTRLGLIETELNGWGWPQSEIQSTLAKIEHLLEDESLQLTLI